MMTVAEVRELLRNADEREFASIERSLVADQRKGVVQALETARRRIAAERAERERLESLYRFESAFLPGGEGTIVGLDEVGRGAVAGPLAVGAVVLSHDDMIAGLNDSKQISPERREEIAREIQERCIFWVVEYVSPKDIDRDGISASLKRAFSGALEKVKSNAICPAVVLVDGNPLHIDEREVNVVKGDAKCASIAAASIVAKVQRDALMRELSRKYPDYGFDINKGYGSPQHIEAIRAHGLSEIHRESFCRSFMQETLF